MDGFSHNEQWEDGTSLGTLVEHFSGIKDPRCAGKIEHHLIDILLIAVWAVIACAESWDDIARYGRNKVDWMKIFLALPNGIPSHDAFRRVFMLIDPDTLEACFAAWAQSQGQRMIGPRSWDAKTLHAQSKLTTAWGRAFRVIRQPIQGPQPGKQPLT